MIVISPIGSKATLNTNVGISQNNEQNSRNNLGGLVVDRNDPSRYRFEWNKVRDYMKIKDEEIDVVV